MVALESIAKAAVASDGADKMRAFSHEHMDELEETLPGTLPDGITLCEALTIYLTLCHSTHGVYGQFCALLEMISTAVEDVALEGLQTKFICTP
jgi:hypothetical protein